MFSKPKLPSELDIDPVAAARARYVEPVQALHFPVSAKVLETQLHLDLRTLLYQLLSGYLGDAYTVGLYQFVYLDASNPRRNIAPDVYAKHTPRGERITTWKVWERGAPELAIEVISDSDSKPGPWEEKFATYQALGVQELVAINLMGEQPRLRVWNRVNEVLTERVLNGVEAESLVLAVHWVIAPFGALKQALRIATHLEPLALVPTAQERAKLEAERAKLEAEGAKLEAEHAKLEAKHAKLEAKHASSQARLAEERAHIAEARIQELEALLRAKGSA